MKGLCYGFLGLFLLQACDLSPEAMFGGKERGRDYSESAVDSLDPYSTTAGCGISRQELVIVEQKNCTSSGTGSNFASFSSSPVERIDVSAGGDLVYVRLEDMDGSTTPKFPKLKRLEYRNVEDNSILRFTCSASMSDTYGCVPSCVVSYANRDSGRPEDCVAVSASARLAQNVEGDGIFAPYRFDFADPECGREVAYGEVPGKANNGTISFCDKNTHERKMPYDVTIPSLDWSVPPSRGG